MHAALSELYENHKVTYLEMSPHIHKAYSYITFSNTLDNKGKRLTGLKFVLLVGSSFLNTGTISESFRVSGNLFSSKALLINFVSSLKQNSEFFNMSTGISPAVALSEGRFFTTFFTVSSETE